MAIIKSLGIGRGRKSAGNVTYRIVRGRTIASEKVGERPTSFEYSAAQLQRQAIFSFINRFIRMHAESIDVSFSPTRYGSARNRFMKVNYAAFSQFSLDVAGTPIEVDALSDAEIDLAVTDYATANPTAIRRVDLAGRPIEYLTGAWDDDVNPEPGVEPLIATFGYNGETAGLPQKVSTPNLAQLQIGGNAGYIVGDTLLFTGDGLAAATISFITTSGSVVPAGNFEVKRKTNAQYEVECVTATSDVTKTFRVTSSGYSQLYVIG